MTPRFVLKKELEDLHAPLEFYQRCQRAAEQEVMHARLMAKQCFKENSSPPPLKFGQLPKRSIFELAMDNAIEGCVFETYAALRAHYQANHAQDLNIKKIMKLIAKDETEHAQLAWDIHQWLMKQLTKQQQLEIHRAQQKAFEKLAQEVAKDAQTELGHQLGNPQETLVHELANALVA